MLVLPPTDSQTKMPLRLFVLRDQITGRYLPGAFFHTKVFAKKALRELNNSFLRVTYGPDHKKYRG